MIEIEKGKIIEYLESHEPYRVYLLATPTGRYLALKGDKLRQDGKDKVTATAYIPKESTPEERLEDMKYYYQEWGGDVGKVDWNYEREG